jgi:predicted ATPase
MLETVRQYGRERLNEAGETESTCAAHLRFYVAFVEVIHRPAPEN